MNPSYKRMTLYVEGIFEGRLEAVREAANEQWTFQLWNHYGNNVFASGKGFLNPHENKEEFADRLSLAIWDANQGYCDIEIQETYVEFYPHSICQRDKSDYERLGDLRFPIKNQLRKIMSSSLFH